VPQLAALDPKTLEPLWKALADFGAAAYGVRQSWQPMQLVAHMFDEMLVVADREKAVGIDARSGKRTWVFSVNPPSAAVSAIFGANQIFVTDLRGKVTAIDPMTGKRLWEHQARTATNFIQIEPGSEFVAVVSPPTVGVNAFQARGGVGGNNRLLPVQPRAPAPGLNAAAYHVACLSAVTGKLVSEIKMETNEELTVQMTEADQLLVTGGQIARCYAPSTGSVVWEAGFRDGGLRGLAVMEELFVAARDSETREEILALSMETGKILWRAALEEKGRRVWALAADVQQDQVLITGALQSASLEQVRARRRTRRYAIGTQISQVTGARLAAIGLSDGGLRWLNKLAPTLEDSVSLFLQAPLITETQAITVARRQNDGQLVAYVTDASTGLALQELRVEDRSQPAVAGALRFDPNVFNSPGVAGVVNGALVIEGAAEIQVFDSAASAKP
jgi:outer membrane protein assembly factor BamB